MKGEKLRLIKGKINTRLTRVAPGQPAGRGWFRDPRTGLWMRPTENKNIVVLAGLSMMAKSIQYGHADQGKSIRYMAVGTGFTYPTKSDTALVSEAERAEINSWDNTDIASDPVVMIASRLYLTTEANGALMECGLFQESSGAPMFCRGLFGYGVITNATQADPCVITSAGHPLVDSDKIYIESVVGMTELNDNSYYIDKLGADTYALYTDADLTASVDSSGYGAYTSGGTWKVIIPKTASVTLTVTYSLTFPAD